MPTVARASTQLDLGLVILLRATNQPGWKPIMMAYQFQSAPDIEPNSCGSADSPQVAAASTDGQRRPAGRPDVNPAEQEQQSSRPARREQLSRDRPLAADQLDPNLASRPHMLVNPNNNTGVSAASHLIRAAVGGLEISSYLAFDRREPARMIETSSVEWARF
jgi:hypothetical protein